MAGTVMHLVIADRLMDAFDIRNPGYFYCGNLAPDAIMSNKHYTREMKRHTHFKDGIRLHELRQPEKYRIYLERLQNFYERFVLQGSEHFEIYFGYFTHMLVDELYLLRFRDGFVDQLLARGKEPTDEAFFQLYTKDVDLVDWELARTYPFRYPMPETLLLKEPYEIPDYVTYEDLMASKEFIIQKDFLQSHPGEELSVMTLEQNLEFIELSVRELPLILKDRYPATYRQVARAEKEPKYSEPKIDA